MSGIPEEDVWATLEDEMAQSDASNQQGPSAPVTVVRPRASITNRPTRPFENARGEVAEAIRNTKPFGKGISPSEPVQTIERDDWGVGNHSHTIPAGRPAGLLPISDDTPLRGIAHEDLKATRSPENLFRRVNSRLPEATLNALLRAPTREMRRDEKDSLLPDRPRSDAPKVEKDVGEEQPTSLAKLVAQVDTCMKVPPEEEQTDDHMDPRPTLLPPPNNDLNAQIEAIRSAIVARETCTKPTSSAPIVEESIITSEPGTYKPFVDTTPSIIIDESLDRGYYITDPKIPWWKNWSSKIKKTAHAISRKVRETLSSIFSLRTYTRKRIWGVLAAAGLSALSMVHDKPTPHSEDHQAPVVNVPATPPVAPTPVPTLDIETPVTPSIDQTPIVTHSATVTVDEYSPHITFVQALTSFLTSNGARANLGRYQHHTGDAIRILHSLERNSDLAETAAKLRHQTHRGDQFSFAVMSDGSIRMNHWRGRRSLDNKLPAPITFALPQR